MKLNDPADKALDAAADGNFGGKQGVNRRAGYGDRLDMALRFAKKGACLSAGEGQLIVEHYERILNRLREPKPPVVEAVAAAMMRGEHMQGIIQAAVAAAEQEADA